LATFGFIYLDQDDIEEIHNDQLAAHGGQAGIRNQSGLASAVEQPKATFGGEDLYPDVFSKAAAYAYFIAENQVFVDGNKRTGLVAALTFLRVNGVKVPENEYKLYEAMIAIAKKEMSKEDLAELFRSLAKWN
jgi:death-on-curing protein